MARWKRAVGERGCRPRTVDGASRRALLAVLAGDLDAAERVLATAVRRQSVPVEPYLALARLYRRRGEIGRAIRIHQNLLLRRDLNGEERLEALLGLAEDFRRGGFLRRAIAAYEEALLQRPRHPAALRALVRLLADARDHRRALRLERRLAKLEGRDPRPAEATLWLAAGETARAEGRTEEARRALGHALRYDPRSTKAWIELGELEAERGRPKRALAAWRRVPEIDRRSGPRVYPRLEATFAALGRPRDHEKFLRGLIEREPADTAARLALARALAARGETEEARFELRRVLEREPDRLEAHRELGRILIAEQQGPEAVTAYRELLDVLERQRAPLPEETLQ